MHTPHACHVLVALLTCASSALAQERSPAPASTTTVHFETTKLTAALEAWVPDATAHEKTWQTQCTGRCTIVMVPSSDTYFRIGGEDVVMSPEFQLSPLDGSDVRLEVKAGSMRARNGGIVLVVFGSAIMTVASFVLFAAAASNAVQGIASQGSTSPSHEQGGWFGLALGSAMLAGGVTLFAWGGATEVKKARTR